MVTEHVCKPRLSRLSTAKCHGIFVTVIEQPLETLRGGLSLALSFRSVRPCSLDPVCLSRALPQEVLHLMTEKKENRKWSRFASGLHTYPTHQRIFD